MTLLHAIATPVTWYRPSVPERNPAYLRFLRTRPCVVCGSTRWVEAAHTGAHGISQKSSDWSAVPLCRQHHRAGKGSYHAGARRFFTALGMDLDKITRQLRNEFDRSGGNT